MTLRDALSRVSEMPDKYTIRFWDRGGGYDDTLFPTTVNIVKLCEDWYSNCDYCPENGEFVYGVTFANDSTGQTFMPEIEKPFELTFEGLMRAVEDACGFK